MHINQDCRLTHQHRVTTLFNFSVLHGFRTFAQQYIKVNCHRVGYLKKFDFFSRLHAQCRFYILSINGSYTSFGNFNVERRKKKCNEYKLLHSFDQVIRLSIVFFSRRILLLSALRRKERNNFFRLVVNHRAFFLVVFICLQMISFARPLSLILRLITKMGECL